MKKILIALGVLAVIVVILLLAATPTNTSDKSTTPNTENSTGVDPVDPAIKEANPIATIDLGDFGIMKFVLFPNEAPETVNNFISLANDGFYDGLILHRIVTDFVAQGGDPEGIGIGGPGYNIKGEFTSNGVDNTLTHKKGALAMARSSEPDSAGSQFYVCLEDVTALDGDYAVFGYMISGAETLDKLQAVSTSDGTPKEEVTIKSVTVDTKGVDYPQPEKIEA